MSVHFVSLKGARSKNEDRHTIILNNLNEKYDPELARVNFYGVYDGHGGRFVSKFLSDNIHHFFMHHNVKFPLQRNYVDQVYSGLQNILFERYTDKATECGSTCLVAIQFNHDGKRFLNIMNTGDSRAVLCRDNLAVPLTRDHKPDWPDERRRIQKLGGKIYFDGHDWRIDDLSVSRAFGDKSSEKHVTNIPDIYLHQITEKDRFMVMGCDGLWDCLENHDVINFVLANCYDSEYRMIDKDINIAKKLANYAIDKGSKDNVTVIVVFF